MRTVTTLPNPFPDDLRPAGILLWIGCEYETSECMTVLTFKALVLLSLLLGVLPPLSTAFLPSRFVLSAHVGLAILSERHHICSTNFQ